MIAEALATDGLIWVLVAAFFAGLVRGFTGFGTAMVYLPVAGQMLSPVEAIATLIVMDLLGPLPLLPRAWRDADRPELARLAIALAVGLPIGVFVLTILDPTVFRYAVSLLALVLLVLLVGGVRYYGPFTPPLLFGAVSFGGFLAGSVGMGGPPVIMLYMASPKPPSVIRANTLIYLFLTDVGLIFTFAISGLLTATTVIIGLLVAIPYTTASILGARIFNPNAERAYRTVAYVIIALSALSGLPLFD